MKPVFAKGVNQFLYTVYQAMPCGSFNAFRTESKPVIISYFMDNDGQYSSTFVHQ